MKYIDFLKMHDSFDKYVLLLLALGFSITEVSKMLEMSRQNIYGVIKRNQDIVKEYVESVAEFIDNGESNGEA